MPPSEGEPSAKRAKVEAGGPASDVLRRDMLSEQSRAALRKKVASSEPYTHGVLHDIADKGFMVKVRDEIIHNIQATYKETDLFKIFQTGAHGLEAVAAGRSRDRRARPAVEPDCGARWGRAQRRDG